jgi:hypothetical protein
MNWKRRDRRVSGLKGLKGFWFEMFEEFRVYIQLKSQLRVSVSTK